MNKIWIYLSSLKEQQAWLLLAALTLFTRLLFTFTMVDLGQTNYWEYGEIAHNLYAGKGYSLFYLLNGKIDIYYHTATRPFPSAYVPPGYVLFLYPFWAIKNIVVRNILILCIQHLVAAFTSILLFRFTRLYFSAGTGWMASFIYACLPELIFASNSYGPTVFYHALLLLIFLSLSVKAHSLPSIVRTGVWFAVAIYFRSEASLFLALTGIYLLATRKILSAIVLGITVWLLLLPWQIRNYQTFRHFIPLTTNTGINLYRGHNPDGIGAWGWERHVYGNTAYLTADKNFELRFSAMYQKLAADYIIKNPQQTLINTGKKLFHLWIVPVDDARSFHPLYFIPWVILFLFFLWGLWANFSWHKLYPLYLFMASSTLATLIFFALPRYQTLLKIAILPLAAYGIIQLVTIIRKHFLPLPK